MTDPREVTKVHTRLSRCALEVDNSRAFWARVDEETPVNARLAFDEYWFGARSLARVRILRHQHASTVQCVPVCVGRAAQLEADAARRSQSHLPLASTTD